MAAKSCGGDIETARTSLFNERIREINLELDDWKQQTVEASQMAICDAVCEREFDPDLFPEGAERLRTWIGGWLTDRSISSAIRMWYADKVQEAKDSLAPQYDAEFQVFAEDCKSSHMARMANMQTESERELLAFKSTIRLETDELKANVLRASNKASLMGKLLLEIKASLDAEAQADLDSYISKLKADTEAAKDVARKKASSGLNQAQRVALGSSHKTARARATPSARPTPRLPSTSLPGEVVPSSQTPLEMSPAPSDRSLPPITTMLPPAPASPSPHKHARSESTTPTPCDPIPAAPLPQRVVEPPASPAAAPSPSPPAVAPAPAAVEAPVDGLVAALAAFSEQLHTINSRLERIETREADQHQFDEVYDAWQRDADMAEADDVPEEYRYGADGQHPPALLNGDPTDSPTDAEAREFYCRLFNVNYPPGPLGVEVQSRVMRVRSLYELFCAEKGIPLEMNANFVSRSVGEDFVRSASSFNLWPCVPPGQTLPGLPRVVREVLSRHDAPLGLSALLLPPAPLLRPQPRPSHGVSWRAAPSPPL
ncbi:hypothetical protein BC826DRAFT_976112 [Russula brevipes]|nr:hypothetical protein BC826DRAFT_976112 [Russula brevipes]